MILSKRTPRDLWGYSWLTLKTAIWEVLEVRNMLLLFHKLFSKTRLLTCGLCQTPSLLCINSKSVCFPNTGSTRAYRQSDGWLARDKKLSWLHLHITFVPFAFSVFGWESMEVCLQTYQSSEKLLHASHHTMVALPLSQLLCSSLPYPCAFTNTHSPSALSQGLEQTRKPGFSADGWVLFHIQFFKYILNYWVLRIFYIN